MQIIRGFDHVEFDLYDRECFYVCAATAEKIFILKIRLDQEFLELLEEDVGK